MIGISSKVGIRENIKMNKIEIIACDKDDLKAIQRISRQTFSDTFDEYNTKDNMNAFLEGAYNSDKLANELSDINSQFYIVKVDGDIAGYSKLNFKDGEFELERIYVDKAFQKYGIGKILLDHAISSAKLQKCDHINLGVWEHNENAKAFYKKMGFERIGQHIFQLGDSAQTDYILTKKLS